LAVLEDLDPAHLALETNADRYRDELVLAQHLIDENDVFRRAYEGDELLVANGFARGFIDGRDLIVGQLNLFPIELARKDDLGRLVGRKIDVGTGNDCNRHQSSNAEPLQKGIPTFKVDSQRSWECRKTPLPRKDPVFAS